MATPKAVASPLVGSGAKSSAVAWAGTMKPKATNRTTAPILSAVRAFCAVAPARRPRWLTAVSRRIAAAAVICPAVRRQLESEQVARGEQVAGAERGEERAEVLGEPDRERRDPPRHDDQEARPAVEEPGQRPVGLAQVDVDPAGPRVHRAELGVGERPREREQPTHQPDQQQQTRVRRRARDVARHQEDPGADHRPHRDQRPVPRPELAREPGGASLARLGHPARILP